MRDYALVIIVLVFVWEEDEGLIGTYWYAPSSENWRGTLSRSYRMEFLRAAKWEQHDLELQRARLQAEYKEWVQNCEVVNRLSA